jgi:hypothetical protein
VSSFIVRVMNSCNTDCSVSSVGSVLLTNSGAPSVSRRHTPSSAGP